jgi:hypothetical protein
MATNEIAKEIVLAMIEKGSIPFWGFTGSDDAADVATTNAKAVAAAYEAVYAGLLETYTKQR